MKILGLLRMYFDAVAVEVEIFFNFYSVSQLKTQKVCFKTKSAQEAIAIGGKH